MGRRECEERETDRERKGGGSETYNNNCFRIIGKSFITGTAKESLVSQKQKV